MQKIILATGNPGKIRELLNPLVDFGFQVVTQIELGVESVEETGLTFIDNALIKARHAARAVGLPALADDSGICVDFLGGAPGIYSARYAGNDASDRANLDKLLETLKDVPKGQRYAQFHCVLAFVRSADDPLPLVFQASWTGELLFTPSGSGGFGYDPIFYLPDLGCTSAELTREHKNRISHRGQALRLLLNTLQNT